MQGTTAITPRYKSPSSSFPSKEIFCVLIFFFISCSSPYDIANLDSQGESVVCLGDSLTAGTGVGAGEDFPSLLGMSLPCPVVNAGIPGDTTSDALARLERDVLSHNPRIVIVLLGGNDYLQKLPKETTRKNLDNIVRSVREGGAMAVIVGIKMGIGDSYGDVFKEISRKQRALYIPDIMKGVLGNRSLMSDPIHPNAEGYKLVAEKLLNEIHPLLAEADKARKRQTSSK